jgi:Mn-dependent DtxR family transcriptional regulator
MDSRIRPYLKDMIKAINKGDAGIDKFTSIMKKVYRSQNSVFQVLKDMEKEGYIYKQGDLILLTEKGKKEL